MDFRWGQGRPFTEAMEMWKQAGIAKCLVAHEYHHVAQYNCFCPGLCKNQPDGAAATVTTGCINGMECFAYAGQLNCMIGVACAIRRNLSASPINKEILAFILQQLDAFYLNGSLHCELANISVDEEVRRMKDWELMRHGRPCKH